MSKPLSFFLVRCCDSAWYSNFYFRTLVVRTDSCLGDMADWLNSDYYTLRKTCSVCGRVYEKLKQFYATGEWLDFELDETSLCERHKDEKRS